MSNRRNFYSNDPQVEQPNVLRVVEVEPGVFFLCDQDGPVESTDDLDAGPYSVQADAEHELTRYSEYWEDRSC